MLPVLLLLACEDRDRDTGVTQSWVVWDDTGAGDTDTHDADSGDTAPDTDEETGDTGEPCPPDTETVLWLCNAKSTYLGRPGEYASTAHVGDFDGDGQLGLAISAPSSSYGTGYEEGLVYVVNDPTPGTTELSTVGDLVYGSGGGFKLQVGATLDANSDGTTDAAFSEWMSIDMETEVYLLTGPLEGVRSVTQAGLLVTGGYNSLLTPEDASGDLDGDGVHELLLRTYVYGADGTAALVAFPGDWTGSYEEEDAAWAITWTGNPNEAEYAGAVVADLTGDGVDDLVLGTPWADDWHGAVRVFEAPVPESQTEASAHSIRSGTEHDYFIGYDSVVCDFDGDGVADLATASPSYDRIAESAGAVWIALGPLTGEASLEDAEIGILGRSNRELLGGPLASADQDADGRCELALSAYTSDSSVVVLMWQQLSRGRWYDSTADLAVQSYEGDGFSVDAYTGSGSAAGIDMIVGWSRGFGAASGVSAVDVPWSEP